MAKNAITPGMMVKAFREFMTKGGKFKSTFNTQFLSKFEDEELMSLIDAADKEIHDRNMVMAEEMKSALENLGYTVTKN